MEIKNQTMRTFLRLFQTMLKILKGFLEFRNSFKKNIHNFKKVHKKHQQQKTKEILFDIKNHNIQSF